MYKNLLSILFVTMIIFASNLSLSKGQGPTFIKGADVSSLARH